MIYVTPWLPGFDDAAKSFFGKFLERRHTAPSSFQVGTYSAVRSYLKAAEATNSDDPKTVFAKMRATCPRLNDRPPHALPVAELNVGVRRRSRRSRSYL